MFTIKIDTDALKRYAEKLTIFGNALPGVTHKVAEAELAAGVAIVKAYPTAHGKYQRTGEYGDKTTLVSSPTVGNTMKFEVISAAVQAKRGRHYSSYVGGTAVGGLGAAAVIKYGWVNLYSEIVKKRLPRILGNVDTAIQALAVKMGVK